MSEFTHVHVDYLRGLASGAIAPRYPNIGACDNVWSVCGGDILPLYQDHLETFTDYSGCPIFPIMGGMRDYEHAYAVGGGSMWNSDSKYGRSRMAFCDWVADLIENHKK
jgi:hypothetical protein